MSERAEYTGLKSFEDLLVWQEARHLRNEIYALSKKLPAEEKYLLANQIIRSSRSISANIAEGYGRYHYQEYIQYCRQARGSLQETKDHLICAMDHNYITNEIFGEFNLKIDSLNRKLNGLIKHLKTQKQQV